MHAKDQIITPRYAIYNSDCMEVMPTLPDNSVDLSVYSPPFAGLYNYSSTELSGRVGMTSMQSEL
jgi:DNA modification methylase